VQHNIRSAKRAARSELSVSRGECDKHGYAGSSTLLCTEGLDGDDVERLLTGLRSVVSGPAPRPYRLDAAVVRAAKETALISGAVVERVGELITRKASVKASMGGPLAMAQQSVAAAQQGIFTYARMMGMLSISLGVLNLLPVPIFDGGQLIFLLMEGVRGRPVSGALRERIQQIGVIFVIVLMAMVFVNDLSRIVSGWMGPS
jgi:RIP metalloprotease RseP